MVNFLPFSPICYNVVGITKFMKIWWNKVLIKIWSLFSYRQDSSSGEMWQMLQSVKPQYKPAFSSIRLHVSHPSPVRRELLQPSPVLSTLPSNIVSDPGPSPRGRRRCPAGRRHAPFPANWLRLPSIGAPTVSSQ